jgi:hypothetical protein
MSEAQPGYAINPDPEHFTRVLLSQPRIVEVDGHPVTLLAWFNGPKMRGKPQARAYLIEVATHRHSSITDALAAVGGNRKNGIMTYWSKEVPGFDEVEDILWTEPITAANFLCLIAMAQVAAYWRDVIHGKASGPKPEAARFIAHISDPTLRARQPLTLGAPPAPGNGRMTERKLAALLEELEDE